jgi:hypothetical protein
MNQAPITGRQFSTIVRAAIRKRVPGAKITDVAISKQKFPTGARGFVATGKATGKGRTAHFRATSSDTAFRVVFFEEGPE